MCVLVSLSWGSLPSEDADCGPPVRRHDLPHDGLELEDDVRNVEDGQQPVVAIAVELEVLFHACDLGISNKFHTRSAYGRSAHVARDVYTRCWSGPGRRGDLIPVSLTLLRCDVYRRGLTESHEQWDDVEVQFPNHPLLGGRVDRCRLLATSTGIVAFDLDFVGLFDLVESVGGRHSGAGRKEESRAPDAPSCESGLLKKSRRVGAELSSTRQGCQQ